MAFVKLVKADEDKFKQYNYALSSFYKALEGNAVYYKKEGLSKEDIMAAIEEATIRLEDVFDEI